MNIGFFKGDFQYDVVNYFVDELSKVFQRKGHNIYILDLCEVSKTKDIVGAARDLVDCDLDLLLKFNGIDMEVYNGFYEELDIICGILLVDHPFYHYNRIKKLKNKNTFISVYDQGALESAEKYIDSDAILTQLMHGGSCSHNENYEVKKYDVIFMGGLKKRFLEVEKNLDQLPDTKMKKIAEYIYINASKKYTETLDDYLNEAIEKFELDTEEVESFIKGIYPLIDHGLRIKYRYDVILNLIRNGIKVDYFGNCELDELENYDNFINHGPIKYEEALKIMSESKILIHDTVYFKNGSHERIFSAMLNGALVLSNTNNYCFNMYKDKENIVFYDINRLDELEEKVKYYLNNEEERQKIVENAYEITSQYNTWDNRAEEILEIYDIVRNM